MATKMNRSYFHFTNFQLLKAHTKQSVWTIKVPSEQTCRFYSKWWLTWVKLLCVKWYYWYSSTALYAFHGTVSMVAVYYLKIKYNQDKLGAVLLDAFDTISLPLEHKHAVNEHHVILQSNDTTQQKMPSRGSFQCSMWLVWNKLAVSKTLFWRRQKKKKEWVSRSTGKSRPN